MGISDSLRRIPGVAAAEGALNGALATEQDLPITGYDKQRSEDIVAKLNGEAPWSGYDAQSVMAAADKVIDRGEDAR